LPHCAALTNKNQGVSLKIKPSGKARLAQVQYILEVENQFKADAFE